jgi:PAS domain S-box-containing protein
MDILKKFASFVKHNHLRDLAVANLAIIRPMNMPLMKYFDHMPEEDLLQISMKSLSDFLTDLENGTAIEKSRAQMKKWENNELDEIAGMNVEPSDLVLVSGAQNMALMQFITRFTENLEDGVQIMSELSAYYIESQENAFSTMFRIRKKTEDALVESEERFRVISQSAADAIIIFDLDYIIQFWNKAAENIFGYEEEEAIGHSFLNIIPKERHEVYYSTMEEFKKSKIPLGVGKTFEITCLDKQGKSIPVEMSNSFFETSHGSFFSVIIHDITERKEATNNLEEETRKLMASNEELEQFAYVASHDMKEPLRMVSNYVQLLEKKYSDIIDAEGKQYISYAVDGTLRMRTLINDLLEYSRINRDDSPLVNTDLNTVVQEVKTNLHELIAEKKADIQLPDLPEIKCDRMQMVQLFQNLIGNGLKFMPQGKSSEIKINCDSMPYEWKFSISDNGIGINEEFQGKIFKMFQRLHHREEYPGTGIGLAICKKIVERHKGRIWFESALGKGTTFFFTISKSPNR